MTEAPQWSNFVINSDTEFNATNCQTQLVKKQHANQFITVYCSAIVPDTSKDITNLNDKSNNNRFLVCGTSIGQIHVYQFSNTVKALSSYPVVIII